MVPVCRRTLLPDMVTYVIRGTVDISIRVTDSECLHLALNLCCQSLCHKWVSDILYFLSEGERMNFLHTYCTIWRRYHPTPYYVQHNVRYMLYNSQFSLQQINFLYKDEAILYYYFYSISNQNNYTNTKIQQVLLILVTYVMTDNVQNTYVTLYHISSLS